MNKKAKLDNALKFLLLAFGIVLAMYFVFGDAAFITSPLSHGNYSGTILLNCTTTLNSTIKGHNATFYYNASGGPAYNLSSVTNNLTGLLWNTSANWSMFNATAGISGFADFVGYNITCLVNNGTTQELISTNVTIDNTPPAVNFNGTNTINNGNYTNGTRVINVTVVDATIGMKGGSVIFNISNSSGGRAPTGNYTIANLTAGGGNFYNATVGMSTYPDGKYNITVLANDSTYLLNSSMAVKTNLNNTERIQITIDRTAPSSVTIANTTSTTTTSVVATITAVDATSGINNCVADTSSGVVITGTGTGTQTLTHTGLTCGTAYNYIITCYDQVGNSLASAQTSLSTSPCTISDSGSSSSVGGGSSSKTQTWTKITPGAATIIKNFDKDTGVKEI